MKKWKEKELEEAIEDFLSFTDRNVMENKYQRNFHNIEVKMNSLGIKRGINYKVNDEKIIERYKNNETLQSIAESYDVDLSSIKNYLQRNNIDIRRTTKKYQFNEDYFEKINSEDKAYFLGLLFADGCNLEKESRVVLTLHNQDDYIIERLKKYLELDKPKKLTKIGYSHLLINSPKISKDLARLGCVSKKTLVLKFPTEEQVPPNLIHHFIRGYFDGDGSVSLSKNKLYFNIVSTSEFLIQVQNILMNNAGLSKTKFQSTTNEKIKILKYSGNGNAKKIAEYLYKNATIYLQRKYDKFYNN